MQLRQPVGVGKVRYKILVGLILDSRLLEEVRVLIAQYSSGCIIS